MVHAHTTYACIGILVYECLSFFILSMDIWLMFIFIDEAPTARVEPETQTVAQGTTGTLRCIVTGSPRPTITWSRVPGTLTLNHNVGLIYGFSIQFVFCFFFLFNIVNQPLII